jgi:hypothetical protein
VEVSHGGPLSVPFGEKVRWVDGGRHLLYWRDQLVGVVTDVGWTDFSWVGGKIAVGELSDEVRAVLEDIDRESKTLDGLR